MPTADQYHSEWTAELQDGADHQGQAGQRLIDENENYISSGKLKGRTAIITGGESGIARATALLFAKEGADVCLVYSYDDETAELTVARIEEVGAEVIQFDGDLAEPDFCEEVIQGTLRAFGRIDILVNIAGEQRGVRGVEDMAPDRVERVFRTNMFTCFYLSNAALPHLKEGSTIINTASIEAYDPSPCLMDYACTQAAIVNFTRSLAKQLAERKIRVNAVAPGHIQTQVIPKVFKPGEIQGEHSCPAQPVEIAPAYLFLATEGDSSFITGQVLHVNGGHRMFQLRR